MFLKKLFLFCLLNFFCLIKSNDSVEHVVTIEESKIYQRQFTFFLEGGEQESCFSFEVETNQEFSAQFTVNCIEN